MPIKEPTSDTKQRQYESVTVSRRSLVKLAGIAGVTVSATGHLGGVAAQDTDEITITMNINPIFDRVLIQETETEERTAGGIVPGQDDGYLRGTVRAAGEVEHVDEHEDVLYLDTGVQVSIAGEAHRIVNEEDILAIVHD